MTQTRQNEAEDVSKAFLSQKEERDAPRILILDAYILNGGDAAMLLATVEGLKKEFGPATRIDCTVSREDQAKALYPDLNLVPFPLQAAFWEFARRPWPVRTLVSRTRKLRMGLQLKLLESGRTRIGWLLTPAEKEVFRAFEEADLIISSGGTFIVDQYDLDPLIFRHRLAIAHGKPFAYYPQSIGPLKPTGLRDRLKTLWKHVDLIMTRDEPSALLVRELAPEASDRILVLCDVALLFAITNPLGFVNSGRHRRPPRAMKPRLAVTLRDWSFPQAMENKAAHRQNYRQELLRMLESAVREFDADLLLVSTCQGISGYADDSVLARQLASELPEDVRKRVTIDSTFRRPEKMLQVYAEMDLVISARMHGAILALCAGVPVVTIAYEFKTTELFNRLGLSEYCHAAETLLSDDVIESARRMLTLSEEDRAGLFESVKSMAERAHEAPKAVRRLLESAREKGSPSSPGLD